MGLYTGVYRRGTRTHGVGAIHAWCLYTCESLYTSEGLYTSVHGVGAYMYIQKGLTVNEHELIMNCLYTLPTLFMVVKNIEQYG